MQAARVAAAIAAVVRPAVSAACLAGSISRSRFRLVLTPRFRIKRLSVTAGVLVRLVAASSATSFAQPHISSASSATAPGHDASEQLEVRTAGRTGWACSTRSIDPNSAARRPRRDMDFGINISVYSVLGSLPNYFKIHRKKMPTKISGSIYLNKRLGCRFIPSVSCRYIYWYSGGALISKKVDRAFYNSHFPKFSMVF